MENIKMNGERNAMENNEWHLERNGEKKKRKRWIKMNECKQSVEWKKKTFKNITAT